MADAERAMIMAQLLSPPLPMVCTGGGGEERVTSSHDLLFCILGRLISLPEGTTVGAYPNSRHNGDWRSHLIVGDHAMDLLRGLKNGFSENSYSLFCMYTR